MSFKPESVRPDLWGKLLDRNLLIYVKLFKIYDVPKLFSSSSSQIRSFFLQILVIDFRQCNYAYRRLYFLIINNPFAGALCQIILRSHIVLKL